MFLKYAKQGDFHSLKEKPGLSLINSRSQRFINIEIYIQF